VRLFGFDVSRSKALQSVGLSSPGGSLLGFLHEPFAGAFQKNVLVRETTQNILTFGAFYACVTLIADDISKLRPKLMLDNPDGTSKEVTGPNNPKGAVLLKPNPYQTRIQFFGQWLVSKLVYGNAYILKERDARGVVSDLYVIDPRRVVPLVGDRGDVYYQIAEARLAGHAEGLPAAPASEVIHDRCNAFYHPLVGMSPIYACAASATQGIRMQANSAQFFENQSRPSGQLTSAHPIRDETAKRLKEEFEANWGSGNRYRMFVAGDGLKYEPISIAAGDAQLIEQLRWTAEDVARCFKVPFYKIGGPLPTVNNAAALNQDYYTQTLQAYIEAIELLLEEGLELDNVQGKSYCVEFDTDALLRMDPLSRMEAYANGVKAGVIAPNEARLRENLPPVEGGDSPYLQMQNFSLEALAKRDASSDPFAVTPPKPAPVAAAEPAVPGKLYDAEEFHRVLESELLGATA
jgi:HK97 family phage portal protein